MIACLSGCDRLNDRAAVAGERIGTIAASLSLPDYPENCTFKESAGIISGDRLDLALYASEAARQRQYQRALNCAAWYEQIKRETESGPK